MKLSKEAKVGLLAVISLAILYVGFKFLKGIDFFDPTNTYYAIYEDVNGLTVSNPVKINGYRIGRVADIKLLQAGEKTKMLVAVEVTDELTLYKGSAAVLVDDNLLGNKAIVLNVERRGEVLADGDTLVGVLEQTITEMIKSKAEPIIADVDTTITRVNDLLNSFSGSGNEVEQALAELRETATLLKYTVVENRRNLGAITANLSELSSTLNDPNTGLRPFLAKMNMIADTVNSLELKRTIANANNAVNNLQQITQNLQQGQGSLGKLLNDESLYKNLNRSAEDLDVLIQDIRKNPGRYVDLRFSLIGGGK